MLLSTAVIVFSLGTLTGPMLVGLYRVLLAYTREGTWQPEQLWGKTTLNNLYGGIVYFAMLFAVFLIGIPVSNASEPVALLVNFVAYGVIRLLWFYTFQILSDHDQPWTSALRKGWNLQSSSLGAHLLLTLLLNLLLFLPTDTAGWVLQFLVLLIVSGFSVLAQTVAYALLVPKQS